MVIFSKKDKATPKVQSLEGVPVLDIVDSDSFVDKTYQGKETTFKIVRFKESYSADHLRYRMGTTHEAVVVRGKGSKEYEALLGIQERKVIKSFVDKFYG